MFSIRLISFVYGRSVNLDLLSFRARFLVLPRYAAPVDRIACSAMGAEGWGVQEGNSYNVITPQSTTKQKEGTDKRLAYVLKQGDTPQRERETT
jgi:hypothetical protein